MAKFNPADFGATPFDPTEFGATPIEEKGILPDIGGFLHKAGDVMIPQTMKLGEMALGGSRKFTEGVMADNTLTQEQKAQKIQDYMKGIKKGMNKSGLELSSYTPVTGAGFYGRAATGALRGTANALSQDQVTLPDIVTKAGVGMVGESVIPEVLKKGGEIIKPLFKKGGEIISKTSGNIKDVVSNPIKSMAGEKVGQFTEKATEKGLNVAWDTGENNIVQQFQNKVKDKLVANREVRDAMNKVITDFTKTPETVIGETGLPNIGKIKLSPSDLLKTRTQIQNTTPGVFEQLMQGRKIDTKVLKIFREVITKNLHEMVPETLSPDNALRIYHQLGIFGKFGLPGLVASGVLGQTLTSKLGNLLNTVNRFTGSK